MMRESGIVDQPMRERLEAYLRGQIDASAEVSSYVPYTAGLSWITAAFDLAYQGPAGPVQQQLIIKLGSPTGLMAPYSALPQVAALKTFDDSPVPVPRVFWYSDDSRILGAPFFICSRAHGDALNPFLRDYGISAGTALPSLGEQFTDILAALHRRDWQGSQLATLAMNVTPAELAIGQVQFWQDRLSTWATRPYPLLDWVAVWLRRNCPKSVPATVVHGDYRIGNFLVSDSKITAILDWEMVHLGDPHEDLSWALHRDFRLRGIIGNKQFLERYAAQSGIRVSRSSLDYYSVFNLYKFAIINVGAISGFENGSSDVRLANMGMDVPRHLSLLAKAMKGVL